VVASCLGCADTAYVHVHEGEDEVRIEKRGLQKRTRPVPGMMEDFSRLPFHHIAGIAEEAKPKKGQAAYYFGDVTRPAKPEAGTAGTEQLRLYYGKSFVDLTLRWSEAGPLHGWSRQLQVTWSRGYATMAVSGTPWQRGYSQAR
jgi:hypothetical protein